MYGSTRVSLSLDELTALRVAMRMEIERLDQLIECSGDPAGTRAEDRAVAEGLYKKLRRASERGLAAGRRA